jgi:hypothetical protein
MVEMKAKAKMKIQARREKAGKERNLEGKLGAEEKRRGRGEC